ncbi:8673_t:CDS:2 [Ambispora leptoticha]|uniref:8673_t:CDS:1 n=1 Tax=Ambispora leptoticha TaxID=144679 RepID=A0A9N8V7Q7_9GLOM|nr:8673_t:CDS:2 [Ambispora leptoticha]
MKAIKGGLDNISNDLRRNLNAVNPHLGNPHLSKLLTSEKAIWNSLSTWSYEHNESSKYLVAWGKSEGNDLNDVTEKLAYLIAKMSEVEGVLADKYSQYRTHLKDIRTRESSIKDQRFKKESYWSKIEKEERRASTSKHPEANQAIIAKYHKELEKLEKESIIGQEKTLEAVKNAIAALGDWKPPQDHRPIPPPRPQISPNLVPSQVETKLPPSSSSSLSDTKTPSHGLEIPSIDHNKDDSDEIEEPFQDFKNISERGSLGGDSSNEADQSDLEQTDVTDIEGEKRMAFTAFSPPLSPVRPNLQVHSDTPYIVELAPSVNLIPQTAEINEVSLSEPIAITELNSSTAIASSNTENIIETPNNNTNETDATTKTTENAVIVPSDSTQTDNNTIQQTSDPPPSNSVITNGSEEEDQRDRLVPPQNINKKAIKHVQFSDIEDEIP